MSKIVWRDVVLSLSVILIAISLQYVNCQDVTTSPDDKCVNRNSSCEYCVKLAKCLYCMENGVSECMDYPTGQIIPHSDVCALSSARWGVCWVNYEALLITMGILAGVLLLSLTACVYCCCCRGPRKVTRRELREEQKTDRETDERHAQQAERRAERQSRYDEIRQKYGLKKDNASTQYSRFENEA